MVVPLIGKLELSPLHRLSKGGLARGLKPTTMSVFPPVPPAVVLPSWVPAPPPVPAKSRPAIRLPLLSDIGVSVTTVISAIEHGHDGSHVVHFSQYQPSGRVVTYVTWLLAAKVVALGRDSRAHRPKQHNMNDRNHSCCKSVLRLIRRLQSYLVQRFVTYQASVLGGVWC
jgi:hypothetical protein